MKSWRDSVFYGLRTKMTAEQEAYLDAMETHRLILTDSVSGSGKTTLAVAFAHYHGKKLLYLFSPVQEGVMGFRPGNQQFKDSAYYGPVIDALLKIKEDPKRVIKLEEEDDITSQWPSMANSNKNKQDKRDPWVEIKSHIFLRGTNIGEAGDTIVVIDEAQNWTRHELKKTLTRIHDNATVIVTGHLGQIDLPDTSLSGFPRVLDLFTFKPYAKQVALTHNFRGQLSRDADEL